MCAFMCHQTPLLTECLITHITGIAALTTMYALFYRTALTTVCLSTLSTCIWMLTPRYITGISMFSTVYMMMFIQTTLLKTQRLNIRIHSDRKNNYFYSNVYIK
jgi:hypothetical protein